jgi:hypothetical protein
MSFAFARVVPLAGAKRPRLIGGLITPPGQQVTVCLLKYARIATALGCVAHKGRVDQRLRLRSSRAFRSLETYRAFLDEVIPEGNAARSLDT